MFLEMKSQFVTKKMLRRLNMNFVSKSLNKAWVFSDETEIRR